MKITIDTKEDSHDEIKKVIRMLSHLVGDKEVYSNADVSSGENKGNVFEQEGSMPDLGGLFGENNKPSESVQENTEDDEKEDVSEEVKIIEY